MARERSFSEPEALQAAADLFSVRGYEGTSLSMLLEATGLARQSLYNSFGDKRTLYLKAVDCAVERWRGVALAMQAAPDGRAAIERFFDRLLAQCTSGEAAEQACIVSAGLLEGIPDAEVQARLREKWAGSHEILRAAIERGQKDGSIAHRGPSAQLADLLMSLMSGLRVAARAGPDEARLRGIVAFGLSMLDRTDP